jgi:phage gp16-like protein
MPLTTQQIRIIHVAKTQLALDDAEYRSVLRQLTGKDSSKQFNQKDFQAVMHHFDTLGFQSSGAYDHLGHRPGMATPKQLQYISGLWKKYAGKDQEAALNHWLENKFGITNMRFASRETAQQAITALKSMVTRHHD